MEPIVVYPKSHLTLRYLLTSIGMMSAVIFIWIINLPAIFGLYDLLMIFSALFFATSTYFIAKRLFQPKPLLIVDEKGITDYSTSIMGFGTFPWEEITDIQLTYYRNQTFISVYLVDEDKYIKQVSPWKRMAYMANRLLGAPLINITLTTSTETPEEIFFLIQSDYGHRYMNKTKQVSH